MSRSSKISEPDVLEKLKAVQDPDLGRDIVSLGFVQNVKICLPVVSFDIQLTTPACPVKDRLKAEAEAYQRRYLELLETLLSEQFRWPALGEEGTDLDWGVTPRVNISVKPSAFGV